MAAPENKALAQSDVEQLMKSWRSLNDSILQLSEPALVQLLRHELMTKRRHLFLARLHHRFNHMRLIRERQLMNSGDTSWL